MTGGISCDRGEGQPNVRPPTHRVWETGNYCGNSHGGGRGVSVMLVFAVCSSETETYHGSSGKGVRYQSDTQRLDSYIMHISSWVVQAWTNAIMNIYSLLVLKQGNYARAPASVQT